MKRLSGKAFRESRRRRGQLTRLHRGALHGAQGSRCAYCPQRFSAEFPATVDHVWPQGLQGGRGLGNTLLACEPCNARKADRKPHPCELLKLWSVNIALNAHGWIPGGSVVPPFYRGS